MTSDDAKKLCASIDRLADAVVALVGKFDESDEEVGETEERQYYLNGDPIE